MLPHSGNTAEINDGMTGTKPKEMREGPILCIERKKNSCMRGRRGGQN